MEDYIVQLFVSCVGSKTGTLGKPELQEVLKSLGSPPLAETELDGMLLNLDRDGDGKISLADFTEAMGDFLQSKSFASFVPCSESTGSPPMSPSSVCSDQVRSPVKVDPPVNFGTPLSMRRASLSQHRIYNSSTPKNGALKLQDPVHDMIESLAVRAGCDDAEMNSVLETIDAYAEALLEQSSLEDSMEGESRAERAEKRCEQLRQEGAAMAEEYQKLEKEMKHNERAARRTEELTAENERLQNTITKLHAELAEASDLSKRSQATISKLQGENEELHTQQMSFVQGAESQDEKREVFESKYNQLLGQIRDLTDEVDSLHSQLSATTQEKQSLEDCYSSLQRDCGELEARVVVLQNTLEARDLTIASLRDKEQQQMSFTPLELGAETTPFKGSIMNELEDLVTTQLKGNEPENDPAKQNFLQQLLPHLEQASNHTPGIAQLKRSAHGSLQEMPKTTLIPKETIDNGEKMDDILRLYAASTQHLAGLKIVTREQAENMDLASLRKLSNTMRDLVSARNHRLIESLAKKDTLRTEIEFKRSLVLPVLSLIRLGQLNFTENNKTATNVPPPSPRRQRTPLFNLRLFGSKA